MLEVVFNSLRDGSSALHTVLVDGWLDWWQTVMTRQNEEEEEEETLTSYQPTEEISIPQHIPQNSSAIQQPKDPRLLGWEFKIVRAKGELFRNPAIFQQLCEEESEAGWILLEKLDDKRVRFKRPIALREMINPELLPFDPYRCQYGSSWAPKSWLGVTFAILTMIIPAYLAYMVVAGQINHSQERSPAPPTKQTPFLEQPTTP